MSTWKLSIKPDSESGFNPFDLCKDKSLLGVGWSAAYEDAQALTLSEAKVFVKQRFDSWPYALKKLLEEVKGGDHVWLHQQGNYYLCRAKDEIVFGDAIDKQFIDFDLGHARKADWVKVPEMFVSGVVQRGTIAQRMIQRIYLSESEKKCHEVIFDKLSVNGNWLPDINESLLIRALGRLHAQDLYSIMTPDEIEDMVSAYLQSEGWFLVKSTCFRSKPMFEFSMVNRNSQTCYVQVKSGKNPDPLSPANYEEFASINKTIILFSTHSNAYPGERVKNVICLSQEKLFTWLLENTWSMTEPLKLKLWMHLCEQG
jgi:hypothetical protein